MRDLMDPGNPEHWRLATDEDINQKPPVIFSIDYPYSFITRKRPKGWALIWLRTRYFFPDLWWEIKTLYWKATGQSGEE